MYLLKKYHRRQRAILIINLLPCHHYCTNHKLTWLCISTDKLSAFTLNINQTMKYFTLVLSSLFLVVVIVNMADWILITTQTNSFEEAVNLHISNYPEYLRNPARSTLLNIVLGVLAGIGFINFRNKTNKAANALNIFAGLSFFLASWQLFSLM